MADELAREGLHVHAFAERQPEAVPATADDAERELRLVGLAAFTDPLRAGVSEAVAALRTAGVGTIVVTGDHPLTGAATARAAGLEAGAVLNGGAPLAAVGTPSSQSACGPGTVIGRATPEDKLRVVRTLQRRGEAVALTGDGANDAPALAAADVGIAMGRRGTPTWPARPPTWSH